ncbi:MAG: epoxide hydrolase family protein [Pseudolysinimonas sp.]
MAIRPFRIDLGDEVLDDLRTRLARTRFTTPSDSEPGRAGFDPSRLRELVDQWAGGFDWRGHEARLNAYPQFVTTGPHPLHFVHARAPQPSGVPILLAHGWPSSFAEMLPLLDRLVAAGHDVVVPSLPGFLFSALQSGPWTRSGTANAFHELMTGELGYARYGAFGGDIGGTVAAWLGAAHPENVVAIHMIHPPFPSSFDEPPLTPEEQAFLDAEEAFDATDGGYSAIMITRPDTIAAALLDSPAGLLAWIADKWRDWSDCYGDLRTRLPDDDLLVLATLYWATSSIGTASRQYYDFSHNPARPLIEVPSAFTLSSEPGTVGFPRSIAERACADIVHWNEPGRGGHFLAWEEPDLMAAELTQTFAGRA